jgi:hypothetical protein
LHWNDFGGRSDSECRERLHGEGVRPERMLGVLPQLTTVVEVPGAGHAPSLLEPESLQAIKQFLGR